MHSRTPDSTSASSVQCWWVSFLECPSESWTRSDHSSFQVSFVRIVCICWSDARMNCADVYKCHRWVSRKFATARSKRVPSAWGDTHDWRGPFFFSYLKIHSWNNWDYRFDDSRQTINIFLCITQLGFCCVYFVFVAVNLQEVVAHYFVKFDIRIYLLLLLIPMIFLNFLKNLKYLTPVSLFASILTVTGE